MQVVYDYITKAAGSAANVIIYGESGTGKELTARSIHDLSARKNRPFIPVNCGAIPEELLESEFFGYRKGAFTGATSDKEGFFDLAEKGTLFLDELGEISLNMQVKLLRVLDGTGYMPVGGRRIKRPDVRIIAATNRNLQDLVRKNRMREDFFYRIHIIPVYLPPLRERKEDIPLLADHFLEQLGAKQRTPDLDTELLLTIQNHSWPGNIRELQNAIQQYITLDRFDLNTAPGTTDVTLTAADAGNVYARALEELETALFKQTLVQFKGHRERAAAHLGIPLRSFYRKLKQYGLVKGR